MKTASELTVGIGGLGAIGLKVARTLDSGLPGLRLAAVSARDPIGAAQRMQGFSKAAPVVPLGDLAALADVVVECAPAAVFAAVAEPAVEAGRMFMPLSCGALLRRMDLVERAEATGARIIVPTGALVGFDAVRAAAEGIVHAVAMETRKPPKGLAGAPHLARNGISVENLEAPLKVFEGTAREAAAGFPANVNVAAALSLAGIGPDRTMVTIWADPTVDRNTHRIRVDADSTRFELLIEGVPSPDNPATGMLTPLSVVTALRGLTSTLRIGS